ncbi:MFS transporter [Aurantiacibacter xanthus]|uniref:MFS transporter n=1 Tax=Aurantiacibacter xanthus TaxID=1784712 RepID=A0A3A1P3K5_9SPHN|nr:MFS transporter [Aurantiacibacter xanthus]RIV85517.1 MFS transporter [Aurantiacibacter xanthus]
MSEAIGARLQAKITLRLIVPIAIITFVNSIDRVNISYAGSAMSADLGLSPDQFGWGVSMFFLAYLLFQYVHVRLLRAWGIKRWIFVSMMLWGVSGFWMAHITSAAEFYAARFLLGMAEAGFAPGMTWLISQWAPPAMRARMLGGALVAVPLSMVLGGPLCGWLLEVSNPLGWPAWRYMFLLLTVPNVLLAVLAAFYLVDRPDKAHWLDGEERAWLAAEFARQEGTNDAPPRTVREIASDPWLWRCSLTWLLVMTGSYALVFWLPQLVRALDLGDSEFLIGSLSALPLLALAIGLVVNGRRSDRKGERLLHTGLPAAAAGVAMMIAALLPPGLPVLLLLCVAGLGIGAAQGVFWAIPGFVKLGGDKVPVGVIALISMFGTAGGIIGPWLTGVLVASEGNFSLAIALLASLLVLALPVIAWRGRANAGPSQA